MSNIRSIPPFINVTIGNSPLKALIVFAKSCLIVWKCVSDCNQIMYDSLTKAAFLILPTSQSVNALVLKCYDELIKVFLQGMWYVHKGCTLLFSEAHGGINQFKCPQ